MGWMFNDQRKKSMFPNKPRMVDGCCEQNLCCGQDPNQRNCGVQYFYTVNGLNETIVEPGFTLDGTTLLEADVVQFYMRSLTGDNQVLNVTRTSILWTIPGIFPVNVPETFSALVGRYIVPADPNPVESITVTNDCTNTEDTFTLTF